MMRRGIHPQDFIALIAGVYAILSPMWTDTTDRATTTMIVLGAVLVVLSLAELVRPDMLPMEGLTAIVGVLFFISPWVMSFSDTRPMAWTAWIVGVVTFAVGAADLQVTRSHRGKAVPTH
jgi:hypothetical protein